MEETPPDVGRLAVPAETRKDLTTTRPFRRGGEGGLVGRVAVWRNVTVEGAVGDV